MAMLKFLFYLFVMLVFVVAGLVFSFRNNALVNVDLFFIQSHSFSIGFWLLSFLVIGVVLGMMLAFPKRLFQSIKIQQLLRKNAKKDVSLTRVNGELNKGS